MPLQEMNLVRLTEQFQNETECRAVLAELRWPEGVKCPRCDGERHTYDSKSYRWDCYSCGYSFTVMSGTVFHDTKLPLRTWLIAVAIMVEAKKGISAKQIQRTLGIKTYKTAWYLCHRIRSAMKDASAEMLKGIVEVDETYVGGKTHGKGRGYRGNKTMVLGAVERGGNIRLKVEKRNDRKTLHSFIRAVVDEDTEAIFTDSWPAYQGIGDADTRHETVNHSEEEWVRGDVHTNTVEGVWSLFKRSVVGSYHQLSAKHMQAYLDEMAFRFDNRSNPYLFRDTLMRLLSGETLEYKELIAN